MAKSVPPEIPSPDHNPDVAKLIAKLTGFQTEHDRIALELEEAERKAGLRAGQSLEDAEAAALVEGRDPSVIAAAAEKVDALKYRLRVLAKAAEKVDAEAETIRDRVRREIASKVARETWYPAMREAAAAWLKFVIHVEAFRGLVSRIQDSRLGGDANSVYCPFNNAVPVSRFNDEHLRSFIFDLMQSGAIDRAQIDSAFPDLI